MRNIALGHQWLEEVKRGATMSNIAARQGVSQQRVAGLIDLAFLAPDIIEAITLGKQRPELTTDVLVKSPHRLLWSEQRTAFLGS